MEGAVWVDSEPGKGSVFGFMVNLPVAEGAVAPHLPINLQRVLAVDDLFINRTILERQLEPCGVEVTLCRSGADALDVLSRTTNFDAVLTDHSMPEMDGLTLASRIRALGLTMPIVLLSSNPAQAREGEGSKHLAAILQKPILRADLYRKLQDIGGVPERAVPVAPVAPPKPHEPRAMRILAAEDNRTNQLVFQKMVRDIDIELVFANNGREAVELFRTFKPDMIFMDISMPEMDGRQATRAIRALENGKSHLPIVALTAHAMDGDAEGILAAGIDRYMTKPLRKAALCMAMAEFRPKAARPIVFDQQSVPQLPAPAKTGT
jgi:CheY-like chemotaxis protein